MYAPKTDLNWRSRLDDLTGESMASQAFERLGSRYIRKRIFGASGDTE